MSSNLRLDINELKLSELNGQLLLQYDLQICTYICIMHVYVHVQ